MQNLKMWAKNWTHEESGTTFYLLPYRNYAVSAAEKALMRSGDIEEGEQFDLHQLVFAVILPITVDVEWGDELSTQMKAFKDYWNARSGSLDDDWQLFKQVIPFEPLNVLSSAFYETRDKMLEPDVLLDTNDDGDETSEESEGKEPAVVAQTT